MSRASRELTNVRSPRVKGVRRLAKRAFRQRDRAFLVEGPQALREALAMPGTVIEIFVTAEAESRHPALVADAAAQGIPAYRVSGEIMAEISQTVTPQGLIGVGRFLDVPLDRILARRPKLVVVLASVRDPGNAGTVVRTADAAGASAVVFTDASVDPYNGKCVRASAGSLFHLPLVVGARVEATVPRLRAAGLRVIAADGHAERSLDMALDDGTLSQPTAWIFGNEAWGLPPEVRALADDVLRVPIYGRAESLNLAMAAAVCLYASARAQRAPVISPVKSSGSRERTVR